MGLLLPALAGFFSVSLRSCSNAFDTYDEIISDKSYMIHKNQEQLGASMFYISRALLIWGLIVTVCFVAVGKKHKTMD